MSVERDAILTAQYVALTTYRRDGTPVVTPVWAAAEGDSLFIFSNPNAGKVKRVRNSSRATVAPCTATGTITGAALPAEAFLLSDDQMPKVWKLLVKKYGIAARLFVVYDAFRARFGKVRAAGIVVHLTSMQ
ncbi:MAG: PPOX class F420-dependent oxidoreductase [Candidatus Limnocylindrus sp.]